jgi:ABC-type dipeptide/oligopeptide/nickel transport system ATPase subunit
MIIGITGKIGSGKSTLATYLSNESDFHEYSFASPLKEIGRIFGFSDSQLYGTQDEKLAIHPYWGISAREFLQKVGTDLFREQFKRVLPNMKCESVWIDLFKKKYREDPSVNYVISDVRFKDEARAIRELGGKIIRISREFKTLDSVQTHISETELSQIECDFELDNNGEFSETLTKLNAFLGACN